MAEAIFVKYLGSFGQIESEESGLIGEGVEEFVEYQQKIVLSEFDYALKKSNCELEEIEFLENFVTLKALIPFEVVFQEVFRKALDECNQYGSFLKQNIMVTNVKVLSLPEIKDFIANEKSSIKNNLDMEDEELDIKKIDNLFGDDNGIDGKEFDEDEIDEFDDEE